MNDTIRDILTHTKVIAMIGASSNPERPSHGIMGMLMKAGFKVLPVNPNEEEVLGEPAYKSLADIPPDVKIDLVNVFRRPAQTPDVARATVERGVPALWLQLGISNDEARKIAENGGLKYVENECIGVQLRLL